MYTCRLFMLIVRSSLRACVFEQQMFNVRRIATDAEDEVDCIEVTAESLSRVNVVINASDNEFHFLSCHKNSE